MSYRNDLDALAARKDALEAEVAAKTKDLEVARSLLDDAQHRARLPVLDNLRVAAPCPALWMEMAPVDDGERVRHCGACAKNVYNLSAMTRDEAQALLIEKEGKLCVRYFQRADGTILTADCKVGVKKRRRRRLVVAGATVLLAGAALVMKGKPLVPSELSPDQHLSPDHPGDGYSETAGGAWYEDRGSTLPPSDVSKPTF